MNQVAFYRGFMKAAQASGATPQDVTALIKRASSGMLPALMGAVPGAAAGGYMAYDRSLERKKEDPNYQGSPAGAATLGALGGAGLGGLIGKGIGAVGYERGVDDSTANHMQMMQHFLQKYMEA